MDKIVDEDVDRILNDIQVNEIFEQIVVTGSTGMLGIYHIEALAQMARTCGFNTKIIAVTRKPSKYLNLLSDYYSNILKITDYQHVFEEFLEHGRTHVIHAASPSSAENFVNAFNQILVTNVTIPLKLKKIFNSEGDHFTLFSSGEVYGSNPKIPTSETDFDGIDHLGIRNAYAEFKRVMELIMLGDVAASNYTCSALRIYHTFGPGIDLKNGRIFSSVIDSLITKNNIKLHSDGSQTRTFLYSADLLKATLICSNLKATGAFNVSSDRELSIFDFAKLGVHLGKGEIQIEFSSNKLNIPQSTVRRGLACTNKLKGLGWRATIDLEDAIIRTKESAVWRKNLDYS